jgi:hypothetical protein
MCKINRGKRNQGDKNAEGTITFTSGFVCSINAIINLRSLTKGREENVFASNYLI